MVCQNYFLQVARAGMYVARQQANEVNLNGTSGDNESVHHYADQYDGGIRSLDWSELDDSFDSCRGPDKEIVSDLMSMLV